MGVGTMDDDKMLVGEGLVENSRQASIKNA
jgi:hypothetical protein